MLKFLAQVDKKSPLSSTGIPPAAKQWKSIAIPLLFAVAGCAAAPSDPPVHCPPLPAWSALEQSVTADELPGDGPESQKALSAYVTLRQACRK